MSRALRTRALAWLVGGALVAAATASGCGQTSSGDCTEKATCPDAIDGATGDDVADARSTQDANGDVAHDGSVADVSFDSFVFPDGPADAIDGCSLGEDCTNGIDDNCNGLTDCADPLCQAGFTCFDPVPNGWTGMVALYDATGNPPTAPPACGGAYPTAAVDGQADPNAPAANCGCTCATSNVQCQFVNATLYSDSACQTQCGSAALPPNFCVADGCQAAQSYTATATPTGVCTPTPSKTVPAWAWTRVARACAYSGPTGGGCSGGKCAAKPPSPYGPRCIFASGDVGCPSGNYSIKHTYFSGANDTRDCSGCTCGAFANGSCTGGTLSIFGSPSCTGGAGLTVALSATCAAIPGVSASGVEATATTPTGGGCPAMGGAPTGSLQPTGPTTVCCMP